MKKNTLNVIILTLTLINLVLNVLIVFSVIPTANKTNNLVGKIASIIDLELEPQINMNPEALSIENIDTRTITNADGKSSLTISIPGNDGKNHYAVVTVTVSLDKTHEDYEKLSESFDNAMGLIIGKIDDVISSYSYEEASASKEEMRQQILQEIRDLFQSGMVYEVSFSGFVVQ